MLSYFYFMKTIYKLDYFFPCIAANGFWWIWQIASSTQGIFFRHIRKLFAIVADPHRLSLWCESGSGSRLSIWCEPGSLPSTFDAVPETNSSFQIKAQNLKNGYARVFFKLIRIWIQLITLMRIRIRKILFSAGLFWLAALQWWRWLTPGAETWWPSMARSPATPPSGAKGHISSKKNCEIVTFILMWKSTGRSSVGWHLV